MKIRLDWQKVVFTYVCMALMGASCWLYITWSFARVWMGALVGVGLHTLFLVSMFGPGWFRGLKKPRIYTRSVCEAYAYAMLIGMIGHAAHLGSAFGPLYIGGLWACLVLSAMLLLAYGIQIIIINRK